MAMEVKEMVDILYCILKVLMTFHPIDFIRLEDLVVVSAMSKLDTLCLVILRSEKSIFSFS